MKRDREKCILFHSVTVKKKEKRMISFSDGNKYKDKEYTKKIEAYIHSFCDGNKYEKQKIKI